MSPNARLARIAELENMVSTSSAAIVSMASQLSEAEERGHGFSFPGHWNLLRSMGDAKNLLQYIFNVATDARCWLCEKEVEIKEMKVQLNELVTLLQESEAHRKEIVKELVVAIALATSSSGKSPSSLSHCADDMSGASSMSLPAWKQPQYTAGITNQPEYQQQFLTKHQRWYQSGTCPRRKLRLLDNMGNSGGGSEAMINGCYSSSESGRNRGSFQNGSSTVMSS